MGPFRILSELGAGGMGVVYLAEQREPVRRRVALKVIRRDRDSAAVLRRFQLEQQALAVMNHDAIARVYEAGTTDAGQPWFAMELVEGHPITAYCDEHRLALRQRIELFQKVCAGVHHAHQKGVIHRDLKPQNVLVTRRGEEHVPKVIDFGVARAADHQMLADTVFTEHGVVVGTFEYMPPEQAAGDPLQIDTRSDVYSLGVMLYELLTGSLPFTGEELRQAGLLEIQRILQEEEPPRPSTRVTGLGDVATDLASRRRTSVDSLNRELRRDLDWIVLKAIAKEPERRYRSAAELADDLGRYLRGEPVLAGPPTLGYLLRKFVTRHWLPVAAGAAVLATLLVGTVTTLLQWRQAEAQRREAADQRDRAEQSAGLAAARAAEIERTAGQLARRTAEFDQLAARFHLEQLLLQRQQLGPPWPDRIADLERWLQQDAARLRALQPEVAATLAQLRADALPLTEAAAAADRMRHPRHTEWLALRDQVDRMRRAQQVRDGTVPAEEPRLPDALAGLPAAQLNLRAWRTVDPAVGPTSWHAVQVALAAARAATAGAADDAERANHCDTLAWALFWSGRDDDALAAAGRAFELSNGAAAFRTSRQELERRIASIRSGEGNRALARLDQQLQTLTAAVTARRTWRLADPSRQILHDALAELLDQMTSVLEREVALVEQRLAFARRLESATLAHPSARVTWNRCRELVQRPGPYASHPFDLAPQWGLVPLGPNPATGLLEFYDLLSAAGAEADPTRVPIPELADDGSLAVTPASGVVFVLIPGATFTMGAQPMTTGAHHDPDADADEWPLRQVVLAPFLIARHELTQAQWQHLGGARTDGDQRPTHPVTQVSWWEAMRVLQDGGMTLPTEAQWEYAARGGSRDPWPGGTNPALLPQWANLADQSAVRTLRLDADLAEPWDDGMPMDGPVGRLRASPFGLHDVLGNVAEWCRCGYAPYEDPLRPDDGLRDPTGAPTRCVRGGNFTSIAQHARFTFRNHAPPDDRGHALGLRPVRALAPPPAGR